MTTSQGWERVAVGYTLNTDLFPSISAKLGEKSMFSDIKCGTMMPFL